jgi:hypothetical protein
MVILEKIDRHDTCDTTADNRYGRTACYHNTSLTLSLPV